MSADLIRQALLTAKETTDPKLRVVLVDMAKELSKFTWRDIKHAPKGHYISNNGKGSAERQIFVPEEIWAYRKDSGHMSKSWWLPKEERWCAFTKDAPPTHFMSYKPEPPEE